MPDDQDDIHRMLDEQSKPASETCVLRVVGTIKTDYGITSEAVFGPFDSPEQAFDYACLHRAEWNTVYAPQVLPLTAPDANAPSGESP